MAETEYTDEEKRIAASIWMRRAQAAEAELEVSRELTRTLSDQLTDARISRQQLRAALTAITCGGSSDRMVRIAQDALGYDEPDAAEPKSPAEGSK